MSTGLQNVKKSLNSIRSDVSKEIKRLGKTMDMEYPPNVEFLAYLKSVEKQVESIGCFWETLCITSYRKSDAQSELIHEKSKTLSVTLRDSNEAVTGETQNEVFANAIKGIGIEACHEACKKAHIYGIEKKEEYLVDVKPQSRSNTKLNENGVDYYIYTSLSCSKKQRLLQLLGKHTNCDVHVSYK